MGASLFDAVAGAKRRDAAIDRAEAHGDPDWFAAAGDAIRVLAESRGEFSTDEVWAMLEALHVGPPPEPRAMGAAMRAARRAGVCVPTDRVVASKRPDCHRRPVRVWKAVT